MSREDERSVRAGIGWSPLYGTGLDDGRFLALAEAVDELGCDSLWVSDAAPAGGPAPLLALAAAAARTTRVKLGTNVLVVPPRNPVLLARELANLDVLSGGRLLPAFGLGTAAPAELAALGVRRAERPARLEETVAVLRAAWGGEPVTYEGRFCTLTDFRLAPRPANPDLEVWFGGRDPAALRRTGRIADGWLAVFVSPEEFGAMAGIVREGAAEAGRTIDADHFGTTIFAAPSPEALPPGADRLLAVRPDLAREDHVAFGAEELRALLERFIAQGASKFVVTPVTTGDLVGWVRELVAEAIVPVERAA